MTNELEKQFFDTFGIEPYLEIGMITYPEITDRILLELICIMSSFGCGHHHCYRLWADNVKELKENILKDCVQSQQEIKHQVQKLFKEG